MKHILEWNFKKEPLVDLQVRSPEIQKFEDF